MARRTRHTNDGDSAPEPARHDRGIASVLARLAKLPDPPRFDADATQDPFAVAEILCDRGDELTPDELIECIFELLFETAFDRAKAYILRESFYLDPNALAEDALARLWSENQVGLRQRPLSAWLDHTIARSAALGANDPDMSFRPVKPDSSRGDRLANAFGRILNQMHRPIRQLAWMVVIEGKSFRRVAEETGIPLERVEHVMSELGLRALRRADFDASTDPDRRNPESSGYDEEPRDFDEREFEEGSDG